MDDAGDLGLFLERVIGIDSAGRAGGSQPNLYSDSNDVYHQNFVADLDNCGNLGLKMIAFGISRPLAFWPLIYCIPGSLCRIVVERTYADGEVKDLVYPSTALDAMEVTKYCLALRMSFAPSYDDQIFDLHHHIPAVAYSIL